MRTLSEIQNEILVRLSVSSTVAYYTDAIILEWITQAHKWAASYKKWPFTEARVSTTFASLATSEDGYLVGNYPEGWKPDSIRLLTIGGKRLKKKDFYSFQSFIEDNDGNTDRIWTDRGREYFINPNIDLSGSVSVWGQYTPYMDKTDENGLTIFSDYADEGNQAIVNEVLNYALVREKKTGEAGEYHKQAVDLLDQIFDNIKEEQFGYQTTDGDGMFERFNVLDGSSSDDQFKRNQF